MKKLFVILFFCAISFIQAQTIINAERYSYSKDSTIVSVNTMFSGTIGNSNTNQVRIEPHFVRILPKNEYKIIADYQLVSYNKTQVLNSGYVHLRHIHAFNSKIKTYEFYQIQYNEVLLLTKRQLIGSGLRFIVVSTDSLHCDFGLGVMYEEEHLNASKISETDEQISKYYRAASIFAFRWLPAEMLTITHTGYFQPRISDLSDFRFLYDMSIMSKISKHASFRYVLSFRYDSKPPSVLKPLDVSLYVGFNYSL